MKPINMQNVRSLVFKSETSTQITAIFNETIIKVKTKSGIGVNILFENIIEIFYGE